VSTATSGVPDRKHRYRRQDYRLSAGRVIHRSFSVWIGHLPSFTLLAAIVMSPGLLGKGVIYLLRAYEPVGLLHAASFPLEWMLQMVLVGAVTYGVFQDLRRRRFGFAEVLRAGVSRLGSILIVCLLSIFVVGIGLCALIVPGLMFMTMYYLAIPVAVVESSTANVALARSSALTRGNRWPIFGVTLVISAVQIGLALAVDALLAAVGLHADAKAATSLTALAAGLLHSTLRLPFMALSAIAPVVAYHDLRVGKEGADIEDLVKVFE
jgi:hypothetical protein